MGSPGPGQAKLPLGEFQTSVAVRASWAAGGLVSTAGDVVALADALFGGGILTEATLELMLDATSGSRDGYGLGVSSYAVGDNTFHGHNGRTIGFASSLRHDPTTGTTIVVLANDGAAPTAELATQLMQEYAVVGTPGWRPRQTPTGCGYMESLAG